MIRARYVQTLGILALVAASPEAQMVGRTYSQPTTTPPTLGVRPPSSLPPMTMGSVPQFSGSFGWRERRGFDRLDGFGINSCFDRRTRCIGTGFGRLHGAIDRIPYWVQTAVPYEVPVYVPVPVPVPVYPAPAYADVPKAPEKPYDPTKSKMLTIGGGADGGGGVMRIERLEGNALRLTWRSSVRPVKEVRLFVADSLHKPLRSARVDAQSPSVIFELGAIEGKVAFTGLTVVFADGSTQTTLVPYPPKAEPQ